MQPFWPLTFFSFEAIDECEEMRRKSDRHRESESYSPRPTIPVAVNAGMLGAPLYTEAFAEHFARCIYFH